MKRFLLLILLISVYSFNLRQAKQEYDSYVMAVQWSNGYCKANSCGSKADHVYKNKMTIHGLWPSLKSGKYLSDCTSGVTVVDDGSPLFSDMKQYWPSFAKSNKDFWEHEYNKHGFCMVEEKGWKGYEDYFREVLSLHKSTYKDLMTKAFGNTAGTKTLSYEEFRTAVRKVINNAVINMKCSNGIITELYFYLEKDMSPCPTCKFSNACKSGTLVFK
jgi:ribonuclease T2